MRIAAWPVVNETITDRKTIAFYATLLALVVLDCILIVWILSPTGLATSAYASQRAPSVSDATKPSPFDVADSRRAAPVSTRRKPRPTAAVVDGPR